jgi:SAM-dependent methyltransferase
MTDLADLIRHYERHAVEWDRDRQDNKWNDRVWHERFVGSLPKRASVLDLGCGSGHPVFHLDYDDQRQMFSVFAKHTASGALLMFNTVPRMERQSAAIGAIPCIARACHLMSTRLC